MQKYYAFFQELKDIQQELIKNKNIYTDCKNTEEVISKVTFECICKIMDLIDGNRNENIKYKLINLKDNTVINENDDMKKMYIKLDINER